MKTFLGTIILILAVMLVLPSQAEGQLSMVKDKDYNYMVKTVKATTAFTASDTSQSLFIPQGINDVICYLKVDSLSTADTLNVTIESSPDGTYWYPNTTFTEKRATGAERKELTCPDPYIRFIRTLTGGSYGAKAGIKVAPR